MRRSLLMATLLVAAALAIEASPALAHAFLKRASPAVGSTVRASPPEIVLRFSEKVEPSFSTVQVTGQAGERVDAGVAGTEPGDPMVLHAALKPLAPGVYKVAWRVVSVDTHVTTGDFTFTLAQ